MAGDGADLASSITGKDGKITRDGIKAGLGSKQGCARRVTVRHGPQGGRGGSSWTSAQAWVSRWPTAWARGKCNVIDEPTAPQNLELGQVDLIKTEDLSDRWPQGGGSSWTSA